MLLNHNQKCFDLALEFLRDDVEEKGLPLDTAELLAHELEQEIQKTIEKFLSEKVHS